MAELPSGTVTFLFTDIAGSTRLWQEHPDAMREVLARHDGLVRAAIESHGGYVVKTTGDGAHAAFATAADAVDAAVAAQIAIESETWSLPDPLRVRMGLHSGPAELRDGDYYGTAVNKSARIMSIAHGGQIVLSHASHQLLGDVTVETIDLGEHRLKDLGQPERIFQILHPALPRDFPPLRSLDAFPGNLPVQVTSFVGRDDDVARIVDMLDEARVVTLAGTGGVGKTRLAVQVAAEVLPRFGDGAWFCELAPANDPETMALVIASTLGCVQHPGLSLQASIVEYLKVRESLVVLDNCEQVLDHAADFADAVVQGCPKVTVLATSREALDVRGERVVRVRSLATPERAGNGAVLLDVPSVQLFRDRARDAGADLAWDGRQWEAVGEICQRVDGIPLAIELAAARTVSMNPIDIAGHLDERFRLLTGKRRGSIERHQTLRATVEWSYQLLGDDERLVFDRLGVFAGSFDESAAIAISGDDEVDSWTVTDALASLVAKSMLGTETGPGGETRYTLLETLRQYARERLDEAGGQDRYRRALARHLGTVAYDVGRGALGPDDIRSLARLRAELDNFRDAVAWALDRDDADDQALGLAILAELSPAIGPNPDLGFGDAARRAVPLISRSAPEIRVPILATAAYHCWHQSELDLAREFAAQAVGEGIVGGVVDPLDPHVALITIEMGAGHQAEALEIVASARAHLPEIDDLAAARFLAAIASFEEMAGLSSDARADSERALQIAERQNNQFFLAGALHGRAWALQRADPDQVLAIADRFLEIHRGANVHRGLAPGMLSLAAGARARLGDDPGALGLIRDAVVICRDDGTRPMAAAAIGYSFSPLCRSGRPEVAATLLGALDRGALAAVANFPGAPEGRARALTRVCDALGDEKADQLVAAGAALSYDELIAYAIEHLGEAVS